jgi:hypothetical protein
MQTQERKDANRRGASFNKEEVVYLCWAMDMVTKTHRDYQAETRTMLHAKFLKMRDSYYKNSGRFAGTR